MQHYRALAQRAAMGLGGPTIGLGALGDFGQACGLEDQWSVCGPAALNTLGLEDLGDPEEAAKDAYAAFVQCVCKNMGGCTASACQDVLGKIAESSPIDISGVIASACAGAGATTQAGCMTASGAPPAPASSTLPQGHGGFPILGTRSFNPRRLVEATVKTVDRLKQRGTTITEVGEKARASQGGGSGTTGEGGLPWAWIGLGAVALLTGGLIVARRRRGRAPAAA